MQNNSEDLPKIEKVENIYQFVFKGSLLPLYKGESPLINLGDGWTIRCPYFLFAPVLFVELQHTSGERATWFFDSFLRYIGNVATNLPDTYKTTIIEKGSKLIKEILRSVLENTPTTQRSEVRDFFDISAPARSQVWELCKNAILPKPTIATVDSLPEIMIGKSAGGQKGVVHVIEKKYLAEALCCNFQSQVVTALSDKFLSWPCIVDGTAQPCIGSMAVNDFDQMYKFVALRTGLVFFLLVTQHIASVCGIYIPAYNLVVSTTENYTWAVERFWNLDLMLLEYVEHYGETLEHYFFNSDHKNLCAFSRDQHIGHQLWNTLSGLEMIIEKTAPEDHPDLLVLGGRDSEFFGPIKDLFPDFKGRVLNEILTMSEIVTYIQKKCLILVRFNSNFISKRLRERIIRRSTKLYAEQDPIVKTYATKRLCIVIGVRVENRTVVDLLTFLTTLVDHIGTIAPGTCIILDGQNVRESIGEKPLGSFGDEAAHKSPLAFEKELFDKVKNFVNTNKVSMLITTGQTVAKSLVPILNADCFIAIWGAGLAKYRWLANKPGYVISSRYHLLNPAEMSIYQTPQIMESPTDLVYTAAEYVRDDPDAWQLIPVEGPRHVSFHLDLPAVLADISKFLDPYLANIRSK